MKHLFQSLSKIKNAQLSKKTVVYLKRKKQLENLLKLFWQEGFILGFKVTKKNQIKVFLKYKKLKPCISVLKPVSKPSNKVYFSTKKLWKLTNTHLLMIFSTNKGFKTINQCKKQNLGGEFVLIVK